MKLAVAAAVVLCLSACGGAKQSAPPPTLSPSVASSLAAQSDAVASALAAGDSCRASTLAQRLQRQTIGAINSGRVAPALQEQLSSAVNQLVVRVHCVPPPAPAPAKKEHRHGKRKEHGKKHEGDE